MKKKLGLKATIPVLLAVLVLMVVLKSFGLLTFRSGVRIGFAGNNGLHIYEGSYVKIMGTMIHDLKPSKGSDHLHCEVKTDSGTLHVLIEQRSDGKVLLDREISDNLDLDIEADGKVRIKLTTSEHSGSYRFEY